MLDEERVREIVTEVISQYTVVGFADSGRYFSIGSLMEVEELKRIVKEWAENNG